jgi:hypothetical protein
MQEGRSDLMVSFDTADAPSRVETFYKQALAERGYAEAPDAELPTSRETGLHTLRFSSQAGRRWSLVLSARGKGTAVTAQGSAPLPPSEPQEGTP